MASNALFRISREAHGRLRDIARQEKRSMTAVLELALEHYSKQNPATAQTAPGQGETNAVESQP